MPKKSEESDLRKVRSDGFLRDECGINGDYPATNPAEQDTTSQEERKTPLYDVEEEQGFHSIGPR